MGVLFAPKSGRETRDTLMSAAEEGRQVAEKIEYSPTAIYVHFEDKEDLFHQLCQEDFARLAQVFQSAAMPLDPLERLRFIGRTYVEFGVQYPNHYKLMFMTPFPPAPLDECDEGIKGNPEMDAYAFLKLTVQQAIDAGCFREGLNDGELLSQTVWAAVHGVISLNIAKSHDQWVDWRPVMQRAELMLEVVLRGLVKEGT